MADSVDGREDLLVPYSGNTWWVLTGTTTGLAGPINTNAAVPIGNIETNARAMDVNGDGLDDLAWLDSYGFAGGDTIKYRLRELSGTFSATATTIVGPLPAESAIQQPFGPRGQKNRFGVPDFNGDGRGDVLYTLVQREWDDESHTYMVDYTLQVACPGGGLSFGAATGISSPVRFGDFNGDGKTDLLHQSSGSYWIRFSTGKSFVNVLAPSLAAYGGEWLTLDWDSDGYDDVLLPHTSSATWYLMRSTGEGFQAAAPTGMPLAVQDSAAVGDANGDGLVDVAYNSGGTLKFRARAGVYPDLLQAATDGHGNPVTFSYAPLPGANYTKSADAIYPEQDFQGALYVVNSYSASDGIGGSYTKSFWYYGARVHLQGRGFEGFYARRSTDSRDGLWKFAYFNRLFPYTGTPYQDAVYQPNQTTLISQTNHSWTQHSYGIGYEAGFLPYESQTSTSLYEYGGTYNGQLIRTVVRQNSVDHDTGALYDTRTTTTEAPTANGVQSGASHVERVYTPAASLVNDPGDWCIGRPNQVQLINSHNQYGGTEIARTTNISWDAVACRPTQIVVEPGNAQLQVTRSLGYDAFGNVNSDTVTGIGMTGRTTQTNWGGNGQFPLSVTNALSRVTNIGWDSALGLQASETDPNGIAILWQYDLFGRRTREDRADGTATTWSYSDCASSGCANGNNKMIVVETQLDTGGGYVTDRRLYTDRFDRPIAASVRMLSGAYNRIDREYDGLGRIYREGAPCWWAGCAQFWTTLTYDLLGRVTQASRPVSDSDSTQQTVYSYYEGLTTRTIDALNKQSTKVASAVGLMARSADHDNYYQSFDYDPFGNALRVTDSLGGTLQSNTFNVRGMRTAQTDMAAGAWMYVPNALGEIVQQTDAKSQPTSFEYDELGRMKKRTEPEGITNFNWGAVAGSHNIGRLESVAGPGYSEGYAYDAIGRMQAQTITSDAGYTVDYAYNSLGALHTLTYPTSTSSYRLKLQYDYQNGLLLRVKDFNAPSAVFWTGNDMDARANVISETLGNGIQTIRGFDSVTGSLDYTQSGSGGSIQNLNYAWDKVGNLTQRQDARQGLTENFYYDNLHRLTSTTGPDPTTATYDSRGNALSRTGNIGSGNGNTITWYSYNLPNAITGASSNSSQFFYAPDRSRWKQLASYGGTSETTIYIGGLIEKVTLAASRHGNTSSPAAPERWPCTRARAMAPTRSTT